MKLIEAATLAIVTASLATLAGCAAEEDAPAAAAAEQDFVSKGGVTLTSAGDRDLSLSLMMLDGVKAKTKGSRFIKATVSRKGKSFGAFCNLRGEVEKTSQLAKVSCSIGVETVSNDDDESLGFDVVLRRDAAGKTTFTLEDVNYAGDGTFLGKEAEILGDMDVMGRTNFALALDAREGKDPNKNVFLLARTLLDATAPLLAEKVKSEEVEQPVAVKSLSFGVDAKMSMDVSLALGRTGRLFASVDGVSVLVAPGEPAKGTLAAAAIESALKAKLPK